MDRTVSPKKRDDQVLISPISVNVRSQWIQVGPNPMTNVFIRREKIGYRHRGVHREKPM